MNDDRTCTCIEEGLVDPETGHRTHTPGRYCALCTELRAKAEEALRKSNELYASIKAEHPGWSHAEIKVELKKRKASLSNPAPDSPIIPNERYDDLLAGAFEGGSNYWIDHIEYVNMPLRHKRRDIYIDDPVYAHLSKYPEGKLLVFVEDEHIKPYALTFESFKAGVEVMHRKYPRHYGDFISENDDAVAADVALQCALFGEIIYS